MTAHRRLDSLTLDWFRTVKKVLYARICVDHIYITQALNPHLKVVFAKHRIVSLLGRHGRNVSFDQGNDSRTSTPNR